MDKKDIKLLVGLQCFELGLGTEIRKYTTDLFAASIQVICVR